MTNKFTGQHYFGLIAMCAVIYGWYAPWVLLDGNMYQSGEHIGGRAYLFLVAAAVYGITLLIRQYEVACLSALSISIFAFGWHFSAHANGYALPFMGFFGLAMLNPASVLLSAAFNDVENKTPLQKAYSTFPPLTLIAVLVGMVGSIYLSFSHNDGDTTKATAKKDVVRQLPGIADAHAARDRKDYVTAVKLYEPLAAQGLSEAQLNLGLLYHFGNGVSQDHNKAEQLYRLSANQGNSWAFHNIGVIYEHGQGGVPKDLSKALDMFRKAADLGNAQSQAVVCNLYMGISGVPKNHAEAFRYCKMSADQNDSLGLNNLGVLYENGWGVKKSRDEAFKLFSASALQGNELARENLSVLMKMKL